jgi:tetratricopeptide (TPR) repeat protein
MKKANILWIAALAASIIFAGCGRKTDVAVRFEMERMLNKADRLQEQLKIKGPVLAEADFKELVAAYSEIGNMVAPAGDDAEVRNASEEKRQAWSLASLAVTRIGTLYLDMKIYDKAFEYFKSVADNPASSPTQRNAVMSYMALSLERLGRFAEAAAFYDSLAQGYISIVKPDNPNMDALSAPLKSAEMWGRLGDKDKYLADMDKARNYYKDLMNKYGGSQVGSAAIGKMAASFLQQNDYPQAIDILKNVRDDSTGQVSAGVMLMIADIYLNKMEDYVSAEKTYSQFAEFYPNNKELPAAKLGLGLSLYGQENYGSARKSIDGIEKLPKVDQQTVAQAYYLTALCYEREDKWDLARGQFELIETSLIGTDQAFESALYIPNYYRSRGKTELAQKAFEAAENYINRYAEQNKNDAVATARALGYLVRAYMENNDFSKAAEKLIFLHDHYPQSPEGKFAPLKLGDIYENSLHDTARTIEWLRKFIKENPDAADIDKIKSHIQALEKKPKK